MKRIVLASSMVLATGCAAATPPSTESSRVVLEAQAQARRVAELEAENRAHADRIRQLEGQLALARAEVAELRAPSRGALDETVRIGGGAASVDPSEGWIDADGVTVTSEVMPAAAEEASSHRPMAAYVDPTGSDGGPPRPVLTLYGSPAVSLAPDGPAFGAPASRSEPDASAPRVLQEGRGGASAPLPVRSGSVPPIPLTPTSPVASSPIAGRTVLGPSPSDVAVERYRLALGHVQSRRLPEALAALTGFLNQYPSHPYADNALYWRGEVEYAMRRYGEALRDFQRLVREHPRGNKVPDALLKMGLCHRRMGDIERARAYFRRVYTEFPESVAARLASQEDAS